MNDTPTVWTFTALWSREQWIERTAFSPRRNSQKAIDESAPAA
jgi:hypothetical protein